MALRRLRFPTRARARRGLPLPVVALATAMALAGAVGVYAVLGGADSGGERTAGETADVSGNDGDQVTPNEELPRSLGEVRLASLAGGAEQTLGELLGQRPVVVNIFASRCNPCVRELPAFEAVHRELGHRVRFLGLASRDRPELARELLERTGVTYPSFADPGANAITYFGASALPATVFIDAAGRVAEVYSRPLTERALRDRVAEHFGVRP